MHVDTDADEILAKHAAAHHGVFRGRHAVMAGLSKRRIAQRIADGRWLRLYRDVYRINGSPPTWEGDVLAACWRGGFRAVASCRSAAELHGLPGRRRDLVEITCPRWRRAHEIGVVVHETTALESIDLAVVNGIAVTTPARTLFDLGRVCRSGLVELALENALRRGLTTEKELDATLRRVSRSGRPGGPTLRALLEARSPRRRPTESEMETRLLQSMRAHGLPEPTTQHEVWQGSAFIARVDIAYPDERIAIEYDSDEFHSGRSATSHDRDRRHRLIAAGWLPVDVGPSDLRNGGGVTCAAVSQALRDRRPGSRHGLCAS
jgi:predicted transcriptional regulator of viral defense system